MANTKSGVVLAVGQSQQITAKSGKTYTRRTLYIDCTPYDGITGERSQFENKIMFEFMESKVSLLDNIHAGQVVTVSFDIQGNETTGQDGQTKYFIHVRPYDVKARQMQQPQAPQQQYTPQPTQQPFPPQTDMYSMPIQDDRPF